MTKNLKHKITLIGSTGLIGTHFFEEIHPDDFEVVNAITRRRIPNIENKDFIKQSVHDFSDLENMRQDLKTDILVFAFYFPKDLKNILLKTIGHIGRFFK